MLHDSFQVFWAILPLALIAGAGALLAKRGILSPAASEGLSNGIIYIFLPCLIFDKISTGLDPAAMPFWWTIPLSAVAIFGVGGLLSAIVFRRQLPTKPDLFPVGFIQNAGYLVIALGQVLLGTEETLFATYTFLYVLGHSPLLWSVGKFFVSRQADVPFRWRELITPPLCANLMAIAVALSGQRHWIPAPVSLAVHMLGTVAVPAALVVLGASLSMIRLQWTEDGGAVIRAVVLKLVVIPAIVIAVIHLAGVRESLPLLAFMWVLQASTPQALNLIIMVRSYGGNLRRTGTVLLAGYVGSLITIPLWIALWRALGQ